MKKFDALIGDMKGRLLRLDNTDKNKDDIKALKVEIKAMELLHEHLSDAGRLALSVTEEVGAPPPNIDQIMAVASAMGAYLPVAYRMLVDDGVIVPPPVVTNAGAKTGAPVGEN